MEEEKKELTIEQSFEELDRIMERMQSEELSLDETFRLYKTGISLVDDCSRKIEKIQCEIQKLNTAGE